jgi:hypothetical protein
MSNPNTIFFEGFTTDFTTDFTQVGANLDPLFWLKPSGVGSVDTHPRLDPAGTSTSWNDGANKDDTKFNMYKLSPHDGSDTAGNNRVYTGQGVIALTGFPVSMKTIAGNDEKQIRGVGIGFYINKLASEPSGINNADSHAQRLVKIYNSDFDDYSSDFANASGVIEIDVIHSTGAPSGYSDTISVSDSRNLSLRVRTPNADESAWVEKYFDTNVLGSTWNYLQPASDSNYTRTDQRIISTFIENSPSDKAAGTATFNGDDYYNGLFVEISILPTGTTMSTDYQMQIRLNGMNLYERGKTQDDQSLTGLSVVGFHNGGASNGQIFDRIDFYGSRTGIASFDTADTSGPNTKVLNDSTWIDDIYIIANSGANTEIFTHADNFLGSSTKVFALFPDTTGINQSGSWRQFSADDGYADINSSDVKQYLQDDDGDNTYVYAENNNNALMFNFDNITIDAALNINNYVIGGIKITNSSRAVSTGVQFQNVFAPSGDLPLTNDYEVSGIGEQFSVTGTVYRYQNQYLMQNPITQVKWTPTEINDGHFGIVKRS